MSIKLFENRAILFKKESTYATDAAPVAGTDALLSFEGSIKVEADKLERKQDLPYFGADPFVLVGKRATVEFSFDMIGAANVGEAAPIAPVLLACAHAETLDEDVSATYNPVSSAFASATIYFYHAGILFKVTGARGTAEWDLSIKQFGRGKATFTGIISVASIAESTPGSLTLTAFQTPVANETETLSVTVGGVAVNATKFTFAQNQDVRMFEGSESREVGVVDRMPSGVLTMFAEALATFNPWSIADALTDKEIVVEVDGGAAKTTTLTIPKAQLEYPALTNLDGATGWEIPFVAKPGSGGDEYSWAFT